MADWIYWYAPWQDLDLLLRIELLIWVATLVVALLMWFRVVVLKRPWLRLPHMKSPPKNKSLRS